MSQLLLFPDPRPLVERLGLDFFKQAPDCPGVYVMRDAGDIVLYVGKAKNLRKRLGSYRVANPDRLRKRHLRLLRAVARIQLEECPDEQAALAREAELLLALRPRFNRAGTWLGPRRFVAWKVIKAELVFVLAEAVPPGWYFHGPMAGGAMSLRAAIVRLCWCAIHREDGYSRLPEGWLHRVPGTRVRISCRHAETTEFEETALRLRDACKGEVDGFSAWICERTSCQSHPFDVAARSMDLERLEHLRKSPARSCF